MKAVSTSVTARPGGFHFVMIGAEPQIRLLLPLVSEKEHVLHS
jgi:hypothetical protein